jgi:hypothetical protein
MDPLEDPDDILRANRSRERQFVFDMVFDAKSTQVSIIFLIGKFFKADSFIYSSKIQSMTFMTKQLEVY